MRLEAQSRSSICLKILIRLIGVGCSVTVLILLMDEVNGAFRENEFGRGGTCAFLGDQGSCQFAESIAAIAIGMGALALFLDTWVLRDDEIQDETKLHVLRLDLVGVAIISVLWLSVFINSTVLWVKTLSDRDDRKLTTDGDLKANVAIALTFTLVSSLIYAVLFAIQKLSLANLEF